MSCYACGQPATVLYDQCEPRLPCCSSCGWRIMQTLLEMLAQACVPKGLRAQKILENLSVGAY